MKSTQPDVGAEAGKANVSKFDLLLAAVCRNCPVCRRARSKQKGAAFWLVQRVEKRVCPFCRAYERVYGRPAHQKVA